MNDEQMTVNPKHVETMLAGMRHALKLSKTSEQQHKIQHIIRMIQDAVRNKRFADDDGNPL